MRSFFIIAVLAIAASIVAQDVDSSDIPSQCKSACAPVVSLTSTCDKSNNDDAAERRCICNDHRASRDIPNCAACLDKYSKDGQDNDANDLARKCSFTSTTYDAIVSSSATSNTSASMTSPSTASASGTMSATSMGGTASATGSSTSPNVASSTPNSADRSTKLTIELFGSTLLGLMALVGI
ncbi:hypothetical protein N7489_004732 [Penicillium chrysogenum]|uniref:uncharacterized protein n=1 Tax=Penicillium chrysogenum TaxID=5076 RepID=UPI0024DF1D1D|nr:uncharacterized protein N7489_004732 [Penicillium chrysogenum]KAJ5244636.1 hypothetical protein N7489_004732 [Penicillium chrysogenum]